MPVTLRELNAQYTRLGVADEGSILLQFVPEKKAPGKNRVHVDLTVSDVAEAVTAVTALGGRLERGPLSYPESGTPMREYAVMADPFGNEFCLVRELLPDSHHEPRPAPAPRDSGRQ